MQTLTPVDAFTTPVQGVSNGDAPLAANINSAPQALTNRTEYLGNRVGSICTGVFDSDTGLATNAYLEMNSLTDLGAFDYALDDATHIAVPAPGVYMVHFFTKLTTDSTTDAIGFQVGVYVEGSIAGSFNANRANNDPVKAAYVQGLIPVVITDKDTERIRFRLTGTGTMAVESTSRFTVWRIA